MPTLRVWFVSLCLSVATAGAQHNVLLVVADDMGVDLVAAYGEHPEPARTPVIDGLAAEGILFRNAWSSPLCSPARAAILTGRYPVHTGVGWAIGNGPFATEMPLAETTLAELLRPTHATWVAGKWHLASDAAPLLHPLLQGFDSHKGAPSNFIHAGDSYFTFGKSVDGVHTVATTYATTDTVDDAIDFIRDQPGGRPWFLYMPLNAPHGPFHKPPAHLHGYALPASVAGNIPVHVRAAVEALDTELGRLLASIDPDVLADTLVVFVGDNGTDQLATTAPFVPSKAKGTVYEGGVNVPLIVRGPGVAAGAECKALVHVTDLFATILDVAGVAHPENPDSRSLLPYFAQPGLPSLRTWVYTEQFHAPGFGPYQRWDQAIRGKRYKLLRFHAHSLLPTREELYDLHTDPFETDDLLDEPLHLDARAAYEALCAALDGLLGPWRELGHGLQGTFGVPRLTGAGNMAPGQPVALTLAGALPGASTLLVIGSTAVETPYRGGVLVPSPDHMLGVTADAHGTAVALGAWPPGVPPDTLLYFQQWMLDPGGVEGCAASNALAAIAP